MAEAPAIIKLNNMLVIFCLLVPTVICSCSNQIPSSADNQRPSIPDSTGISPELPEPCYNFDEDSVLSYAEKLEYFRTWRDSLEEKSTWDAPWWYMSDQALADSIAVSNNEVIISFKEPYDISYRNADGSAREIRDVTVQNAIQWVQSEAEVQIIRKFDYQPAFHGTMRATASLVDSLRNQPCIDIVEPNYSGGAEWH